MKGNNIFRRILAGMAAGGMLLLSASCGVIQMRDPYTDEDLLVESTGEAASMLAPAERKNTLGRLESFTEANEPRTAPVKDEANVLSLAFSGDVRIDGSIIKDAANRAADGKSYSFLRMYAGIFGMMNNADVAVGSYSAAKNPTGDPDITHKTPVESLAALSDLGYELLDTTEAGDLSTEVGEYDIDCLSADVRPDDNLRLIEKDGLTLAFLAMGDKTHRHSYEKANMEENIEYADLISDLVIVSVNWGDGMSAEEKRTVAVSMAEAGADIIVGDGSRLGNIEWLDTGDGTMTLCAYSLGNILSTAETPQELCGGVLTLNVIITEDRQIALDAVCLRPTVIHYGEGKKDYQIFELSTYTDELAYQHGIGNLSREGLTSIVCGLVPAEFLPENLHG